MSGFRLPGLIVIVGLIIGGLVLDQDRPTLADPGGDVIEPAAVVAAADARSSTWFCVAATGEEGGLADAQVIMSNTTPENVTAVISVFEGGTSPVAGEETLPLVRDIPGQTSIAIGLTELAPDAPIVSIAAEFDSGGVMVEKVVSGPTGVARSACATDGSEEWLIPLGATVPGARFQAVILNPFPDDAVVDVEFVTETGVRVPETLQALHVPSRSARLIEVGDVVAAADSISTFVATRSGRVAVEGIQSFDGTDAPTGLSIVSAIPATAESWTFPGIAPARGPARLVVVNPSETTIRADIEVHPAGAERFVEPFELTLRAGQNAFVDLVDEGRLAGIESFTLVVRSLDGPRLAAGVEQRPLPPEPDPLAELVDTPDVPTTGFAASPGQPIRSTSLYTVIDPAAGDELSALHIFNPAGDSFVTAEITIAADGASRVESVEVGPQRTTRVPLTDLSVDLVSLRVDGSAPLVAAREVTGLSSRSWAPLLPGS